MSSDKDRSSPADANADVKDEDEREESAAAAAAPASSILPSLARDRLMQLFLEQYYRDLQSRAKAANEKPEMNEEEEAEERKGETRRLFEALYKRQVTFTSVYRYE